MLREFGRACPLEPLPRYYVIPLARVATSIAHSRDGAFGGVMSMMMMCEEYNDVDGRDKTGDGKGRIPIAR